MLVLAPITTRSLGGTEVNCVHPWFPYNPAHNLQYVINHHISWQRQQLQSKLCPLQTRRTIEKGQYSWITNTHLVLGRHNQPITFVLAASVQTSEHRRTMPKGEINDISPNTHPFHSSRSSVIRSNFQNKNKSTINYLISTCIGMSLHKTALFRCRGRILRKLDTMCSS